MKASLLYDAQNLDNDIIDHGLHIAESFHRVRKANELLERWLKEATAIRKEVEEGEEGESQDAITGSSATTVALHQTKPRSSPYNFTTDKALARISQDTTTLIGHVAPIHEYFTEDYMIRKSRKHLQAVINPQVVCSDLNVFLIFDPKKIGEKDDQTLLASRL